MTEELHDVRLTVNGTTHHVRVPARRLLSDALRHDLGLTGIGPGVRPLGRVAHPEPLIGRDGKIREGFAPK